MVCIELYINSDGDFAIYSQDIKTAEKVQQPEKIIFFGETEEQLKAKVQAFVLLLSFDTSRDYLFETITILTSDLNEFAFGDKSVYRDIDFEYGNQSIHINKRKLL